MTQDTERKWCDNCECQTFHVKIMGGLAHRCRACGEAYILAY